MNREEENPFYRYFIFLLVGITVAYIIVRIIVNLFDLPFLIEISKDVDLDILLRGFRNGLIDFYERIEMPPGIPDWPPYYLYFWYFIFFPVGYIPLEIGVYIWDILRLITVSLIMKKSYRLFKNKLDLAIFYS